MSILIVSIFEKKLDEEKVEREYKTVNKRETTRDCKGDTHTHTHVRWKGWVKYSW